MSCTGCKYRGIEVDAINGRVSRYNEASQKLQTNDWLKEYATDDNANRVVEIRFKNTHKDYYLNSEKLRLKKGDVVAVEAHYGHDIGTVSLTGKLAFLQCKKRSRTSQIDDLHKIYRKAGPNDLRVYHEAVDLEQSTMIRSRKIIEGLGLNMKLGDVEYQGDKTKAIFYYIADERVDFRDLIKVLAREFSIRVEMKQIGARQEAGRIGGIGSCGRELCCSSWKTNFQSVTLNAAKVQELPANAQKLAGQCGKLKCCLMYELDTYLEAREAMPKVLLELETKAGIAYHHKTDTLKRLMYYGYKKEPTGQLIPVPVDRVKEIINLNKRGIQVDTLTDTEITKSSANEVIDLHGSIDRFDKVKKRNMKYKSRGRY